MSLMNKPHLEYKPQEVSPGIWLLRIPVPFSIRSVNVYLIETEAGPMLVDCGADTEEALDLLRVGLKITGYGFEDLVVIFVTHHHLDHWGLLAKLKELSGAQTVMHVVESDCARDFLTQQEEIAGRFGSFLLENGMPVGEANLAHTQLLEMLKFATPTSIDRELNDTTPLLLDEVALRTVCTPGHSPKHLCLYDSTKKILISGDHLLPRITSHVGFSLHSGPNPLADYLASLQTTVSLEIDLVLPGHGLPFQDSRQRVREMVQHHEQRLQQTLASITEEGKTAYEIASDIFGHDLPIHEGRLALMEALAHLEWLVSQELLDRQKREHTIRFRRKGDGTLPGIHFSLMLRDEQGALDSPRRLTDEEVG